MSKINLNNYEAFMIDYLEGNLSAEDSSALKDFAVLHPELELNFDEELITLEKENISFYEKENLKVDFKEEFVIGFMENILNEREKEYANGLAKNNNPFKHELNLYKKTIVRPDEDIIYENKAALKRKAKLIVFNKAIVFRIAAGILLLVGVWFLMTLLFVNQRNIVPELAAKRAIKAPKDVKEIKSVKQPKVNSIEKKYLTIPIPKNNNATQNAVISHNIPNLSEESTVAKTSIPLANLPDDTTTFDSNQQIDSNVVKLANADYQEKTKSKYIIIEMEDDEDELKTHKPPKLWSFATKVLKKLNQNGIERVSASESKNELVIGALTISHTN